ncbi:hypothetical protein Pelo_8102 [Pelomyxa schiedti]|nr:hypothetical protein Pelo_8102 [Pelomyxa schiedti]
MAMRGATVNPKSAATKKLRRRRRRALRKYQRPCLNETILLRYKELVLEKNQLQRKCLELQSQLSVVLERASQQQERKQNPDTQSNCAPDAAVASAIHVAPESPRISADDSTGDHVGACVTVIDTWDDCGICLEKMRPLSTTANVKESLKPKSTQPEEILDPPRPLAQLTCRHTFHLDCIMLACASKGKVQCPTCRHTETQTWDFLGTSASESYLSSTGGGFRSRADAYESDEEQVRERRRRQQAFLRMLLSRAMGAVDMRDDDDRAQHQLASAAAAVLLPVPVVPVNLMTEMHACTTGHKRAIFMTGGVSLSTSSQPTQTQSLVPPQQPSIVPLTPQQQQAYSQFVRARIADTDRSQRAALRAARQEHEMQQENSRRLAACRRLHVLSDSESDSDDDT